MGIYVPGSAGHPPLPPQVVSPPLWDVGPVVGWGSQLSDEPGFPRWNCMPAQPQPQGSGIVVSRCILNNHCQHSRNQSTDMAMLCIDFTAQWKLECTCPILPGKVDAVTGPG